MFAKYKIISAVLSLSLLSAFPQASRAASPQKDASSSPSAQEPPANAGFSIETEMFTYKAVKENSQLIACDVARYLYGAEISAPPHNAVSPCTVGPHTDADPGILIVSSSTPLFTDFQLWRADMATMNDLKAKAAAICTLPQHPISEPKGAPSGLLDLTPASQAFSLFQSALGLLANNQSVSPVAGTVRDEALMNAVARELRSLNVFVLIPELYEPYAIGGADYKNSPYLSNLAKLFDARQSCEVAKAANEDQVNPVITSIDAFLKAVSTSMGAPAEQPQDKDGKAPPPSSSTDRAHFSAVFAADGLARRLGFTEDGASGPGAAWQHILWLKALESGGAVSRETNIFGTKVRFSGGAVDTYAVFTMDGNLVCSGNVYNFESPVRVKDLQKSFHENAANDAMASALSGSTCSLPSR